MRIDWRLKSLIFGALDRAPAPLLHLAQKRITRHSRIAIPEIYWIWKYHFENIRRLGANTIVEFGAGKALPQNIYLSGLGIEQTIVDIVHQIDLDEVNRSIDILRSLGEKIDGRHVNSLDDLDNIYGIRYTAPVDMRIAPFHNNAFDMCISTNTLEHIPHEDIRRIFRELSRIVRTGGHISVGIDYSDHYSHSDPNISGLNFLRYSSRQWVRHNHRNHFQNRLRHNHFIQIFTEEGFSILEHESLKQCPNVPTDILPELLSGDPSDYDLYGHFVLSAGGRSDQICQPSLDGQAS